MVAVFQINYYLKMSFPRVVPQKRKVNYTIRNRVNRGGVLYAIGFYGVGEYFGFFDKYKLSEDMNNPADMVQMVQAEDEKSWGGWNAKMLASTVAKETQRQHKIFIENLPVGMQNFIKEDFAPRDEKGNPVTIQTSAPFFKADVVDLKDLVTVTSSKSSKQTEAAIEEAQP